jgi:CelD/BcsL family acetyltransferase involved in cellulose biosynthesis
VKIDVIRPSALSIAESDAWRACLGGDPAWDSPFLAPGWARAVERAQRGSLDIESRGGARVAVIEDDDGTRGYFPLRLRGAMAMPAGAPMCDYQAVVSDGPLQLNAARLVSALKLDRLDFSHMLGDQPTFAPFLRGREISHGVDLSEGYADYVKAKAGQTGLIKDLDKRRRKVEREVGPVRFEAFSTSRTALEKLIAWKRKLMRATGQTDIYEAGWPSRLLDDLFTSRDPDFGAVLFTLEFGDRLVAAHLHLRGRHTIHAWIIGHDDEVERYSPGLLLFHDIMRWMDHTPFHYLDFGAGDYRFKQQFANAGREIGHGFVGRLCPATLVRSAEYGLRAAAERLDLGRVSALPGKAMRRIDLWRGLG